MVWSTTSTTAASFPLTAMTVLDGRDGLEVVVASELRKGGLPVAEARRLASGMDDAVRNEYLQQVAEVIPEGAASTALGHFAESAGEHVIPAWKRLLLPVLGAAAGVSGALAMGVQNAYASGNPGDVQQLLPASGHVHGVGAVVWADRIDVANYTAGQLHLEVTYTPRADVTGTPITIDWLIAGKTMQEVHDPVENLFGLSSEGDFVGSLSFRAVNKEAWEVGVQSYFAADGRVGQFFPGVRAEQAVAAGTTVALPTTVDVDKYRVNFGAAAFEDGTHVRVRGKAADGSVASEWIDLWLSKGQSQQLSDVYRRLDMVAQNNAVLEVAVVAGKAALYGSVIDGVGEAYPGTSDATTVSPLTPSDSFTFLELGKLRGANESIWTAAGSVTNHSDLEAVVNVDYIPRSGAVQQTTITVPAGATLGYQDIFTDLLGWNPADEGAGTVRFTSMNGAQISGVARSFAMLTDGCEDGEFPGQNACVQVGSMGQLAPGQTSADALKAGETYQLLGLRQFEHPEGTERSHASFFNPGETDAVVTIDQYDAASGAHEGTRLVNVPAGELLRMNNVLGTDSDGNVKRLEIKSDNPVLANAYRINQFNDPITIEALLQETESYNGLQLQITADDVVDPIIGALTTTMTASDDRPDANITQLVIDNDGDGRFVSAFDTHINYTDQQNARTASVDVSYDGTWSGSDITRLARVWTTYTGEDGLPTEEYQDVELPLHVNLVSSLEHAWITDPARSSEVITYMQDHKQEISDLLAQGNSQCANTSEEYQEFIDTATGFDDIYFLFGDQSNRMGAWSETAQEGGSMGCVYEAPFDGVLEMVAQYLIDNPNVAKNATTTTTELPTHTMAIPVEMHYTK